MDITQITLKYFFEVNSYLLKTETGHILIDTGIFTKRKELETELERHGCKPGDIRLIILTHGHPDHLSNAAYLRDKHRARIAMHGGDSLMAETADMFAVAKKSLMTGVMGALLRLFGFNNYEKFNPDILLEDGQSLAELGLDATVHHTPGHTPGSISILTGDGELFTGDVIWNTNDPTRTTLIDDATLFEASVEKIRGLDSSEVYPGHGRPFNMDEFTE